MRHDQTDCPVCLAMIIVLEHDDELNDFTCGSCGQEWEFEEES